MSEKNVELQSGGLKCDNKICDWKDETIPIKDWDKWINAKCPNCGDNLLTLDDYNNAMAVLAMGNLLNEFTPEELKKMAEGLDLSNVTESDLFKDAKGLENLQNATGNIILSFDTHKGIKVDEIKPEVK